MTEDHSFELISQAIGAIGDSGAAIGGAVGTVGSSAFTAIGNVGKSAFGTVNNAISSYRNVKLKKLDNDFKAMEFAHESEMLDKRNQHELDVISKQKELLEKIIDTASAEYKDKIDFYKAQLKCIEEAYKTESKLLSEHINYLEQERSKVLDDTNKYMMLSDDLSKLKIQKTDLYGNYLSAQGKLNDAIKCLDIDKSFNNKIENSKKILLENGEN